MLKAVFLSIIAIGAVAQTEQGKVGLIDFYGYKGIGVDAVRAALPIREGDEFPATRSPEEWKRAIRASVLGLLGRDVKIPERIR